MKKKFCFILMALCFLLVLTACQSSRGLDAEPADPAPEIAEPESTVPADPEPQEEPEPALSQREQDWQNDLLVLSRSYKSVHKDPFYLCSEEEFDWQIGQLRAKVNQLSDEDMFFEIAALVAGMGDIHTYAVVPESLYDRQFPIRAQYFGNKLYLSNYQEGYEQFEPYMLHEVVSVNGIDITYLEKKAAALNNPFSYWYSKENLKFYFLPAFFDWAGCDYKEGYTFEFLNDNREVESVEVPLISLEDLVGGTWVNPENYDRLLYKKGGNRAEYVDGENGGCVYLSLSSLNYSAEIKEPFETAIELIKSHPNCGKLVLDLRALPGGLANLCILIENYTQELKELSIEQVYVVTSGYTASAAITCLAYFKSGLDAVIIGEPTGQFSSFFASTPAATILPHSKISVYIANNWYQAGAVVEEYYDEDGRLYPWENTILPDVYIYQDIEDIRQGKDSVLEWVLAQ